MDIKELARMVEAYVVVDCESRYYVPNVTIHGNVIVVEPTGSPVAVPPPDREVG